MRLKALHLLLLFLGLYFITCYYVYITLEWQIQNSEDYQKWKKSGHAGEWPVLDIRRNKNGTWQLLQDECPVGTVVKHSHLQPHYSPVNITGFGTDECHVLPDPHYHRNDTLIVMEEEWKWIDVGYPQYVYTVSGWIQVVEVPHYTAKPALQVFVVPHSHQDIGWRETVDSCYVSYAKKTLDLAVSKLAEHSNWTFIWAEMAYLTRWYSESSEPQKKAFRRAVAAGQLEIVTGGWVMTEEACAHYAPMLDQLLEGHLWLRQELGIQPNVSWSVDPFGHSPTMAYLLGQSGIHKMVIQRVHFATKRYLARKRHLEFRWRQAWDETGATDVSCHMMPFLSYAVLYSCGPDPHICCQFDFTHEKCFRGKKSVKPEDVTDINIKKLAWALWEQFQKKSQLYQSSVILVPHGDDFRYHEGRDWDTQLGNLEKLMAYMNADRDMNIRVKFGTVSDYFRAVDSERQASQGSPLPVLVGDFFPYNDRDDQYWTGFYSSRPLYKSMARVLQARLRFAEILLAVLGAQLLAEKKGEVLYAVTDRLRDIKEARQEQATFMHHDAITGTSKKAVVLDYASRLQRSLSKIDDLIIHLMSVIFTGGMQSSDHIKMNDYWPSTTGPLIQLEADATFRSIIVSNPLSVDWVYVVRVRVTDPNMRVAAVGGGLVRQQVHPVWSSDFTLSQSAYEIIFEAGVPALSVKSYTLQVTPGRVEDFPHVTLYGINMSSFIHDVAHTFSVRKSTDEIFTVQNHLLTATFSACAGTMQHVIRKLDDLSHRVRVQFMTYSTGSWSNPFKDKSGAYIFMPDGPAKAVDAKYPPMIVLEGPLLSSVHSYLPGIVHVTTLYNVTGPQGAGVQIDNTVNIGHADWDNKELVMRIVSDVDNARSDVCVDLNGFQMTRKQWRAKQLIQGNFHPVNTMAFIEDDRLSRLTLVTAQAHGLASLNFGWMEVVLDRRMMQDDWRGLGEGISDNVPTPSRFVILLEKRDVPVEERYLPSTMCRPSMLAELTSDHLNNPPLVMLSKADVEHLHNNGRHALLETALPCQLQLVNLRMLTLDRDAKTLSVLILLRQAAIDCSFQEVHSYRKCSLAKAVSFEMFLGTKVIQTVPVTLTASSIEGALPLRQTEIPDNELRAFKMTFS